jgi:hypothetical protein
MRDTTTCFRCWVGAVAAHHDYWTFALLFGPDIVKFSLDSEEVERFDHLPFHTSS